MVKRRTPTHEQRKSLGRIIHKAQKESEFTQEELADFMKCSAHWISKIECGKSDPNWLDAFRLAAILNLDIIGILEEVDGYVPVSSSRK